MISWKLPPKAKIYEALGALGDGRVEIQGNQARVYSSSRRKFYEVKYAPLLKAIMSNDNGSYWQGYLGYPAVAFLMERGTITFKHKWADALKGIDWKDLNVEFKNDFMKTLDWVHRRIAEEGFSVDELQKEVNNIEKQIKALNLRILGPKQKPPAGY